MQQIRNPDCSTFNPIKVLFYPWSVFFFSGMNMNFQSYQGSILSSSSRIHANGEYGLSILSRFYFIQIGRTYVKYVNQAFNPIKVLFYRRRTSLIMSAGFPFNPIKVLFYHYDLTFPMMLLIRFQSYQGSILSLSNQKHPLSLHPFNPIKVLFYRVWRSKMNGEYSDFQSYQGSILSGSACRSGRLPLPFNPIKVLFYLENEAFWSKLLKLSILSRFYFIQLYFSYKMRTIQLSILSRFYFIRKYRPPQILLKRAFNPIKVLFYR